MNPETVTVSTPGAPTGELDAYREPILGPAVVVDVEGCLIAPGVSREPLAADRAEVITADTVYLRRTDVEISAASVLRYRGADHHVIGRPALWLGRGVVVQCVLAEG